MLEDYNSIDPETKRWVESYSPTQSWEKLLFQAAAGDKELTYDLKHRFKRESDDTVPEGILKKIERAVHSITNVTEETAKGLGMRFEDKVRIICNRNEILIYTLQCWITQLQYCDSLNCLECDISIYKENMLNHLCYYFKDISKIGFFPPAKNVLEKTSHFFLGAPNAERKIAETLRTMQTEYQEFKSEHSGCLASSLSLFLIACSSIIAILYGVFNNFIF